MTYEEKIAEKTKKLENIVSRIQDDYTKIEIKHLENKWFSCHFVAHYENTEFIKAVLEWLNTYFHMEQQ